MTCKHGICGSAFGRYCAEGAAALEQRPHREILMWLDAAPVEVDFAKLGVRSECGATLYLRYRGDTV